MFTKILLALGDGPASDLILEQGLTLAQKLNAKVLLLHVLNPLESHGFDTMGSPIVGGIFPVVNDLAVSQFVDEWQKYEQHGAARLQTYAQQATDRGITATTLQNFGDSAPMICTAAKNWSADLIILGRNQRSVLSEVFLGSTSNYVLHHAPCSVLTIQLTHNAEQQSA